MPSPYQPNPRRMRAADAAYVTLRRMPGRGPLVAPYDTGKVHGPRLESGALDSTCAGIPWEGDAISARVAEHVPGPFRIGEPMHEPEVCGGTGEHAGQPIDSCDECDASHPEAFADLPDDVFAVCRTCGHVERRPGHAVEDWQASECRHDARPLRFDDPDEAEERSALIVGGDDAAR